MKKSFTLIELVVVITVIGILAAMSLPNFTRVKARVLQNRMRNNLMLISKLQQAFYTEHGHYGPGPDNRRFNIVRYYPYTYKRVRKREWILYPPNNLGLILPAKRRYYYYIYWYSYRGWNYFIAVAYANRWMRNDIDGDSTPDYWYVSSYRPSPVAIINDLRR